MDSRKPTVNQFLGDLVKFLENNPMYNPLLVHGFSGYLQPEINFNFTGTNAVILSSYSWWLFVG